jgi:hypothetical protein
VAVADQVDYAVKTVFPEHPVPVIEIFIFAFAKTAAFSLVRIKLAE